MYTDFVVVISLLSAKIADVSYMCYSTLSDQGIVFHIIDVELVKYIS